MLGWLGGSFARLTRILRPSITRPLTSATLSNPFVRFFIRSYPS